MGEALQLVYATADSPSQLSESDSDLGPGSCSGSDADSDSDPDSDAGSGSDSDAYSDAPERYRRQVRRYSLRDHGALVTTKALPQIYFLTSGPPDGGARRILDRISEFDNDRHIPVNSIAFITPDYPGAK